MEIPIQKWDEPRRKRSSVNSPKFMKGLLKSTTSIRFWLMVRGATAMSAFRETMSPTIPRDSHGCDESEIDGHQEITHRSKDPSTHSCCRNFRPEQYEIDRWYWDESRSFQLNPHSILLIRGKRRYGRVIPRDSFVMGDAVFADTFVYVASEKVRRRDL